MNANNYGNNSNIQDNKDEVNFKMMSYNYPCILNKLNNVKYSSSEFEKHLIADYVKHCEGMNSTYFDKIEYYRQLKSGEHHSKGDNRKTLDSFCDNLKEIIISEDQSYFNAEASELIRKDNFFKSIIDKKYPTKIKNDVTIKQAFLVIYEDLMSLVPTKIINSISKYF